MSGLDGRLSLSRRGAGCRQAREHLQRIERQIERRAARMTLTTRVKNRSFRRPVSSWTREDERRLRETIDRLWFERRGEFDTLSRGLARQERAIATGVPAGSSTAMVRKAREVVDLSLASNLKEQAE